MIDSARELARAVRSGELHAVETVERALAELEAHSELNAVITLCADEALARARAEIAGPLAGVPLLVKDVFDTAGVRTTAGSRLFADRIPSVSAPAVDALERAGAIVVAKSNCDEFAWGVTGQNEFYGDCVNPRRRGRIAGGSSSGNAAALAAGMVPLALGSDTGGSVRMPASCCEVVGMKPPVGALSTAGMFPLCPSFDTPGPMARSVSDCLLAYSVLSGRAPAERKLAGVRAGVLTAMPALAPGAVPAAHDERGRDLATRAERLGLRCREVALPVPASNLWPVFYAEAANSHRDTFPVRRDEYGATIRAKLDDAQRLDRHGVDAGYRALAEWRGRAQTEPDVKLFISPTLGVKDIPPADVDELEIRVAFSAYTRVFSFLGWPAIAVGSVQFSARDPELMFAAALGWERMFGPAG